MADQDKLQPERSTPAEEVIKPEEEAISIAKPSTFSLNKNSNIQACRCRRERSVGWSPRKRRSQFSRAATRK